MNFSRKTVWRIKMVALLGFLIFLAGMSIFVYIELTTRHDYTHLYGELPVAVGNEFVPIKSDTKISNMEPVAENDSLVLFINTDTTEVAVYDKRCGEIWYSNPKDRAQDSAASTYEKEIMSSQIFVRYYDETKRENRYNNYTNSIVENQFELESIDSGVRITYRIGESAKIVDKMPLYVSEERMEWLLEQLDRESAISLRSRYVRSRRKPGFWQMNNDARTSELIALDLYSAFQNAGYTDEDLAYDNAEADEEQVISETRNVSIPLEYSLTDEGLSVYINASLIQETENMSIFSLELLRFFGAASTLDEGYLVVPAGSGGLIRFNNGKTTETSYVQQVYGSDPLMTWGAQAQIAEDIRLPVFGIKKDNGAMLAHIAEGDSMAAINADVSGRTNSYSKRQLKA